MHCETSVHDSEQVCGLFCVCARARARACVNLVPACLSVSWKCFILGWKKSCPWNWATIFGNSLVTITNVLPFTFLCMWFARIVICLVDVFGRTVKQTCKFISDWYYSTSGNSIQNWYELRILIYCKCSWKGIITAVYLRISKILELYPLQKILGHVSFGF